MWTGAVIISLQGPPHVINKDLFYSNAESRDPYLPVQAESWTCEMLLKNEDKRFFFFHKKNIIMIPRAITNSREFIFSLVYLFICQWWCTKQEKGSALYLI